MASGKQSANPDSDNTNMDYRDFIKAKALSTKPAGFKPVWTLPALFDFQKALSTWAIQMGRSAIFAGCGLGKTPMEFCWAENVVRKTNGNVLLLTPLAVAQQMVREADKFGVEVKRSKDGTVHRGITITNYQRLHYFDPNDFVGVVSDESSCLKAEDSQTRRAVTDFMAKIKYRLLCTATPAPNDYMELGTSCEALGVMARNQMLAMFFSNGGETTQQWELKGHAKVRFWQWLASWSRAITKPSDLGFDDRKFKLPPLETKLHTLPSGKRDGFFPAYAKTMEEQRAVKRASLKQRCELAASLLSKEKTGLAWCQLNDEGDLLTKLIDGAVQVRGSDSDDEKEERLNAFGAGQIKKLVSKPKMAAFGLNFQVCNKVTYFPSWCYDERTELLTKRGWLSFDKIRLSDDVATVNPDSIQFEWQNPTNIIWSPYEGSMVHFEGNGGHNRSFDLLVTPNHRMFVKRCPIRYRDSSGWEFKTARQLVTKFKRQEYRLLSAPQGFVGTELQDVAIPPYERKLAHTSKAVNKRGDTRGMHLNSRRSLDRRKIVSLKSIPVMEFMQLAGWYLSEGHCGNKHGRLTGTVVITQTDTNLEYRKEIISLLKSIPELNVYTKSKDIRCCSMQLAMFLVEQFGLGSYNKKIPRWVKELPPQCLTVLRDTMLKGDGCSDKGVKRFYRTASKQLADDFSEICIKTGLRGSVRFREYGRGIITPKMKAIGFINPGGNYYDVSIAWQHNQPAMHVSPKVVPYRGMIGCVTVPNGTLIVRRNGIPVVSGNSHEQFYQAIRRCWRFGQELPVTCHIVSAEAEGLVLKGMLAKERQSEALYRGICAHMHDALASTKAEKNGHEPMKIPSWL